MYESYDKGLEALYQGYYDTLNELVQRINNLVVDNAKIKNLNVDKLYATDTKIKTALIEDLVVGGNVTMGANASILWEQIEDVPEFDVDVTYNDIIGPKPPTDANNTYSELLYNSGIRGFVNQGGILYISADYIRAGTMSADYIYGGTISGVNINVTTDLFVGRNIRLGTNMSGNKNIYFNDTSYITASEYLLNLHAYDQINLNSGVSVSGNLSVYGTIYGTFNGSVPWNNVTGKPSTFPPSSHTHSNYLSTTGTAYDSSRLGGYAASSYCMRYGSNTVGFEITGTGALNLYRNGSYIRTIS